MKVLKFTEDNLEKISEVTGKSLEEVEDVFNTSNKLLLETYSVIDYVAWGNGTIYPDAWHMASDWVRDVYKFVSHEDPNEFSEVIIA